MPKSRRNTKKIKRSKKTSKRRNSSRKRRGGMVFPFRMKSSFLPSCNSNISGVGETYDNFGDVKKVLFELQERGPPLVENTNEARTIARNLRNNCRILKNYMKFWDSDAQKEIIDFYQLGPPVSGKRRLVDFIIKMYKNVPLSPTLEEKWKTINT